MPKNYRIGFEPWAAVLLVLIMLPNVIRFALPLHPNDILRTQAAAPVAETIAFIARILMIAFLCFLKNKEALPLLVRPLTLACTLCVLAYCIMWALYLRGINVYRFHRAPVIWGMCLFPCAAFILFSLDRRNLPALVFVLIFTACHAVCTHASLSLVWTFSM